MDCKYSDRNRLFCTSGNTRNIPVPGNKTQWDYYECGRCGTIHIDAYTNVDEIYERERLSRSYSRLHPLVRLKHRIFSHPLERRFGTKDFSGMRVLDIGCGNGEKLYAFYQRGARAVFGTEMSEDKLDIARRYMPEGRFFKGPLAESEFPEKSFDIITVDNVLEHIAAPDAFLREVLDYLKPGGRAVFYVPHGGSLSVRFLKGRSPSVWPPFHLFLFTKAYFSVHLGDIPIRCKTQSHFFMVRHALEKAGLPRVAATVPALLLWPVAAEELVVEAQRPLDR